MLGLDANLMGIDSCSFAQDKSIKSSRSKFSHFHLARQG
jgi:hypothetical protein